MKLKKRDLLIGFVASAALVTGAAGSVRAFAPDRTPDSIETPSPKDLRQHDLQIAAYSHALQADPQSAIALGQLAGLYLQRARETGEDLDYQRSEEYAKRSLALRVNRNAKTFVTLATALMAQHKFADAVMVAKLAVEYDPTIPQYRALQAEAQVELGDYQGARLSFMSLSENRGNLSIAARLARWYELTGNTEDAKHLLQRTADAADSRKDMPNEQLAWFHYRVADIEMRNGKFRRAKAEFDKGLQIEPADYRILSGLAKLALLEGKPEEAIAYAERGIALKLDPATLGILSEAFLQKGDTAAAEENLRTMEVAVRGQPGAYHRAWSLFLLDHGRRLDEVNRNALTELETRKDIYGYDIAAWSYYRLGRYDDAARNMRLALQLGTRDAVLYYHAGMIELASGHKPEARRFLRAALGINARFDRTQSVVAKEALTSLGEKVDE